jgi:zinc protease
MILLLRAAAAFTLITASTVMAVASTAAPTAAGNDMIETPLERGVLPNGFRYVIAPRAQESGRVSLRLMIDAGSLDERDGERGFAHFIEHMAFNGTRHYAPGELIPFFQRLGLAWGPDVNADTSFTYTVYRLDLPAAQPDHLDGALQVLRDFADGMTLAPDEIRRERGVILSELSARDTDDFQIQVKRLSLLYQDTPIPHRLPLGLPAAIKNATAEALRAFYQRCYQADRMTLMIVGDVTPAKALALITQYFSTLPAPAREASARKLFEPRSKETRVAVVHSAKEAAAGVALTIISPAKFEMPADRAAYFARTICLQIIERRLNERREQSAARFGNVGVSQDFGVDGRFLQWTLEAHASAQDWPAALALIEAEVRGARTQPVSTAELKESIARALATCRTDRDAEAGEKPPETANRLVFESNSGWKRISPAEAGDFVEHFGLDEAKATMAGLFPEQGRYVMLKLPPGLAVSERALLEASEQSVSPPPPGESAADTAELQFHYEAAKIPGAVTHRLSDADLHLDRVIFANGVRLNIKSSQSEPRHFRLVARIGRGIADSPRDHPGIGTLAMALLGKSDFNRHTHEELGRLIRTRGISAGTDYQDGQLTFSLQGPAEELAFGLQFLSAFLTDLKLEPRRLPEAVSFYVAANAELFGSSASFTNAESIFQMAKADPRLRFPSPQEIASYSFDTVVGWIRPHWFEGPLEVGLIGDISFEQALAAASTSIGALPVRGDATVAESERFTLRSTGTRNLVGRPLPDKTATLRVVFPTPQATDIRHYRALEFVATAWTERLRTSLREQLGATYSPSAAVSREIAQPDFAFVYADLTCTPARAKEMAQRMIKMADQLARRGISREEFERLRKPLSSGGRERFNSNEWWIHVVLPYAQSRTDVVDAARTEATGYAELTRDEINRTATALAAPRASVFGIIPEKTAAGNPSPKK